MNEKEFITEFMTELDLHLEPCLVDHHKPLLYDLTVEDDGIIRMGVTDSGEPIRGHGKGFEQDVLIYERRDVGGPPVKPCVVTVVPRVVAEVKFNSVTTHDAIVYSEKARSIRTVYPYLRYGLILGGFQTIPGRVLRLGQGFDFIFAISYPFIPDQIDSARKVFRDEVKTSRDLARIAVGREQITSFRRTVLHDARNA
jgi:hypothetical protein